MIVSMTGFGQGDASDGRATATVEVRTVNHRFLDFAIKLPRNLQHRERDLKEVVKRKLSRGRVSVSIAVEADAGKRGAVVDTDLMAHYLEQLRAFAKAHKLSAEVSLDTLVQMPDVIASGEEDAGGDDVWPLVESALEKGLDACLEMRRAEGRALLRDLAERMRAIDTIVGAIEAAAPGVSRSHADALRKRVEQLLGDIQMNEDRLVNEIVLLADRLDISEELTRLRSHEAQFNKALADGGEVSKRLTYLLQEMHREASTIGAKASDPAVIQRAISLKEETEKLREQVQNIE
ncbi:MAG: YicC family protein [Candidatus Krumholzibacteria bacterium]|nr:YicC family protein [Candidatus Krumholzibacteria bacterium]